MMRKTRAADDVQTRRAKRVRRVKRYFAQKETNAEDSTRLKLIQADRDAVLAAMESSLMRKREKLQRKPLLLA